MISSDLLFFIVPLIAIISSLAMVSLNAPIAFFTRVAVIILVAVGFSACLISLNQLLSQPRSAKMEIMNRDAAYIDVMAVVFKKNEAIYMWVTLPNQDKPSYYAFEWNQKLAQRLQEEMRKQNGKNRRGKFRLRNPFGGGKSRVQEFSIEFIPFQNSLPKKPM